MYVHMYHFDFYFIAHIFIIIIVIGTISIPGTSLFFIARLITGNSSRRGETAIYILAVKIYILVGSMRYT